MIAGWKPTPSTWSHPSTTPKSLTIAPARRAMSYEYAEIAKMIDHSLLNPDAIRRRSGSRVANWPSRTTSPASAFCRTILSRCAELLARSDGEGRVRRSDFLTVDTRRSSRRSKPSKRLPTAARNWTWSSTSRKFSAATGTMFVPISKPCMDVAHAAGQKVKVIFENCYLTDDQKRQLCEICGELRADWVKTSTGYGTGGATTEDLILMRQQAPAHVQVKAAGGVRRPGPTAGGPPVGRHACRRQPHSRDPGRMPSPAARVASEHAFHARFGRGLLDAVPNREGDPCTATCRMARLARPHRTVCAATGRLG